MLTLVATLIAAPTLQSKVDPVCELGRVAIADLKSLDAPAARDQRFYSRPTPGRPDLLTICPMLEQELRPELPVADEAAMARASAIEGMPGSSRLVRTAILRIEPPSLAPDGKSATVEMSYRCPGLCAAGFKTRYIRARRGWQREGRIDPTWIS